MYRTALYFSQRIALMTFGVAVASGTYAAEWTTSAGVAPAITYTDNVCLSKNDEQGEWIGVVTPDVAVRANGRRANVSVAASVEVNSLSNSDLKDQNCNSQGLGDREQYTPRMNGRADAILIEHWLFIDATAHIDQNAVSPFVSGGDDSLNRTGNTNTTYRYTVSPYISRRFKDAAVLNLRYTWDDQYNTTDIVGESSEQSVRFNLGSVPGLSSFSWGLQGDYSKVNYSGTRLRETDSDNELKSAQLNLGYQINRFWQINGFYGDEWNDFISSDDDIDGEFWDVGVRWTPNSRTTVEAGNGHRFFGDSPRFSARYSHKRSTFTANYVRELNYDRNIRNINGASSTTLSNSPILDKRFTLGYSYQGRVTRFNVTADQSDQTRADNLSEYKFRGVSVSVNRSLSRQLSITGRASWDEQDPKGSNNSVGSGFRAQSENWRTGVSLRRQLRQNINLSLDYDYTKRTSDRGFNEYQENRITLTFEIRV